jgi:hypothetical protein
MHSVEWPAYRKIAKKLVQKLSDSDPDTRDPIKQLVQPHQFWQCSCYPRVSRLERTVQFFAPKHFRAHFKGKAQKCGYVNYLTYFYNSLHCFSMGRDLFFFSVAR